MIYVIDYTVAIFTINVSCFYNYGFMFGAKFSLSSWLPRWFVCGMNFLLFKHFPLVHWAYYCPHLRDDFRFDELLKWCFRVPRFPNGCSHTAIKLLHVHIRKRQLAHLQWQISYNWYKWNFITVLYSSLFYNNLFVHL